MTEESPQFLPVGPDARPIAVRIAAGAADGASPGVFWCGGFLSDMRGTKAQALADWGAPAGRRVVRFDYSGHGESGGVFVEGTISRWAEEARAVYDAFAQLSGAQAAGASRPPVIVGSSMGGWIALLLARALQAAGRPAPAGLVLIAPAPDFTEELMWKAMPQEVRDTILTEGVWYRESEYGPPQPVTRSLIEDGRTNLVLGAPFSVGCPVRILQGVADDVVPWQHAVRLSSCLAEDDVVLTLIKDGDHRLSRPEDIARIIAAVEDVAG